MWRGICNVDSEALSATPEFRLNLIAHQVDYAVAESTFFDRFSRNMQSSAAACRYLADISPKAE